MNKTTYTLVVCAIASLTNPHRSGAQVFEAADVHASAPANNPAMHGGFIGNGRYEVRTGTMVDLIRVAYSIDADKVIGGPKWLDSDRFDVIAKGPTNATPESLRLMLQALLADRFKLVVHRDARPFPEYAVIAGKHPQLKEAAGGGESGCQALPQNAQGVASGTVPNTTVSCRHVTMAEFASRLPRIAGNYFQLTPVVDLTGIEGSWDFTIRFTGRGGLAAAGGDGVSIYSAVEKQLGLKLDVQMVPMPVVVVDRVNEKPTDNLPGVSKVLPPVPTEFEVADIKRSAPGSTQRGLRLQPGGRIDLRGFTLREIVKFA